MKLVMVRLLFLLASLHEAVIGLAILLAAPRVFAHFGAAAPAHWGYVHFSAAVLLIFALMFFDLALRPAANRGLIGYGILIKLAYAIVGFWYWHTLPDALKPLVILNAIFVLAFIWAYARIRTAMRAVVLPRAR